MLLLISLVVLVILLVLAVSKFSVHPFIGLLVVSILFAIIAGLPLQSIGGLAGSGFGNILSSIGLVVVLGALLGVGLEKSGFASQLAEGIAANFGKKHPHLAMGGIGCLVGIPVFCDSGFIVLSRIIPSLGKKLKRPLIPLFLCLGMGLFISHTLIPPTPGPLAVAATIGAEKHLAWMMLGGLLLCIPLIFIIAYFSIRLTKNWKLSDAPLVLDEKEDQPTAKPSGLVQSTLPILLPVFLIALGTFSAFFTGMPASLQEVLRFCGHPVMALLLGLLLLFVLAKASWKMQKEWITEGVVLAGPVLIITGAAGIFGEVLKASELSEVILTFFPSEADQAWLLLLSGFVLSALLKSSQGSSTSAMIIAASMMAPALQSIASDNPLLLILSTFCLGAGAMTVSHANDSYFWVFTQFSGMEMKQGFRSFTLLSGIAGLSVFLMILIVYFLAA